jgi:hypothetical protein
MSREQFENPLRLFISSGNVESRDRIINLGLVVISPVIETVLPPARIADLEYTGLLPQKRWITNSNPRATVFLAKDALDYRGDPVLDSHEAAMNLGSIILASMGRELDVNVLNGPNSMADVFLVEL